MVEAALLLPVLSTKGLVFIAFTQPMQQHPYALYNLALTQ
jgi:hypothetical protein